MIQSRIVLFVVDFFLRMHIILSPVTFFEGYITLLFIHNFFLSYKKKNLKCISDLQFQSPRLVCTVIFMYKKCIIYKCFIFWNCLKIVKYQINVCYWLKYIRISSIPLGFYFISFMINRTNKTTVFFFTLFI